MTKSEQVIEKITNHAGRVIPAALAAVQGNWPERDNSPRATAAVGCWFLGLDHCAAMVILGQQGRFLSGWALMRTLVETYLKGHWCRHASPEDLHAPDADIRSFRAVGDILYDREGRKKLHKFEKSLPQPYQDEVRAIREGLETEVHQNLIRHSGTLTVRKVLSTMVHSGPIAWNMVVSDEGFDTKDLGTFWKVYPAAFAATSAAMLVAAMVRELDPNGAQTKERLGDYPAIAAEWQREWLRITKPETKPETM